MKNAIDFPPSSKQVLVSQSKRIDISQGIPLESLICIFVCLFNVLMI